MPQQPQQQPIPGGDGPAKGISMVAGPGGASEAFSGSMRPTDARAITDVLNNPGQVDSLTRWIGKGEDAKSWPGMKRLYSELQKREESFGRRYPSGAPRREVPRDPRAGQAARFPIQTERKKAPTPVEVTVGKRRDLAAGVIEAAMKWSAGVSGPPSVANIPAPNAQEFHELVRLGRVKAGDVLVSPGGEDISWEFLIVTQKAIDSVYKPKK